MVDVLNGAVENFEREAVKEGHDDNEHPKSRVLVSAEGRGHANHHRDADSHEEVLEVVADYSKARMNQSVFEAEEQVLSILNFVESTSKVCEIDSPEDNLETHKDDGHDH